MGKTVFMTIFLVIGSLMVFGDVTEDYQKFDLIIKLVGASFVLFGVVIGLLVWDEKRTKENSFKAKGKYTRIMTF